MSVTGKLTKGAGRVALGRLLLVAQLALIVRRHLGLLDRGEGRRLAALVGSAAKRRGRLDSGERQELKALVGKLEPRVMLGTAVKRVSPVPLPGRLLYGRRGRRALGFGRGRSGE